MICPMKSSASSGVPIRAGSKSLPFIPPSFLARLRNACFLDRRDFLALPRGRRSLIRPRDQLSTWLETLNDSCPIYSVYVYKGIAYLIRLDRFGYNSASCPGGPGTTTKYPDGISRPGGKRSRRREAVPARGAEAWPQAHRQVAGFVLTRCATRRCSRQSSVALDGSGRFGFPVDNSIGAGGKAEQFTKANGPSRLRRRPGHPP